MNHGNPFGLELNWKAWAKNLRESLTIYNFASDYIRARKYTVRTGAGLTPFLEPGSGVPKGGAEGPFLYLLVTLPLALTIEQDYLAYAPYPDSGLPPPKWPFFAQEKPKNANFWPKTVFFGRGWPFQGPPSLLCRCLTQKKICCRVKDPENG